MPQGRPQHSQTSQAPQPFAAYRPNPPIRQRSDDTMNLSDYIMADSSTARMDHMLRGPQSPMVAMGSASATLANFPDLSLPFNSPSPTAYGLPRNYARGQMLSSPKIETPQTSAPLRAASMTSPSDLHEMMRASMSAGSNGPPAFPFDGMVPAMDSHPTPEGGLSNASGRSEKLAQREIAVVDSGTPEDYLDGVMGKKDDRSDVPPPWSEMKTKAGKERKRLPLACIACRRKKIRCSGEKPACKHCLRSRIPCVYKVTTRKAAPRTDYMAMLDKRLKRMEDRVIKLIPKQSQVNMAAIGRAVVKPPLPPPPLKTPTSAKKRGAEEAFGNPPPDLDQWSMRPGTSSGAEETAASLRTRDLEDKQLLTEGAEHLPSKEIQMHLAETYFENVYGQAYHLLHKPSFMRKLEASTIPPVLMLAVCAISARFSNHPHLQLRTEPAFLRGDSWAVAAREISLRRYDSPNITILIVYVLLGLHEFGTCQGGRSWMFGGMAQRMAYALQLHQEDQDLSEQSRSSSFTDVSATDREIRRRTMWSCFLMDRFNSSGTGRPMFMSEPDIQIQLPIQESYYQMEIAGPTEDLHGRVPNPSLLDTGQMTAPKENMGVAAYTIRLIYLWGKCVQYLNMGGVKKDHYPLWSEESVFADLKRKAREFMEDLPSSLAYNAENLQNHVSDKTANQFLFMHIAFQQIMLFLNHWSIPCAGNARPPKEMPPPFRQDAARSALEAANSISRLIEEALEHNVVAPFAGYCAFSASTVHVYCIFSSNSKVQSEAKQNLATNVKYLSKMKKYWGMFHFVAENLKESYRLHADASIRGETADGANGKAVVSIFQYGDWYDRYPHGVNQTDYEDPLLQTKQEPGGDAVMAQKTDLQSVEEFFATLSPASREQQKRKVARAGKQVKPAVSTTSTNQPATDQAGNANPKTRLQLTTNRQQRQDQHAPISLATPQSATQMYFPHQQTQQQQTPQPQLAQNQSQTQQHQQPPFASPSFNHLDFLSNQSMLYNAMDSGHTADLWTGMEMTTGPGTFFEGSNWFMPFNLDPPDIGEDIFTGSGFQGGYGFGMGGPPPVNEGVEREEGSPGEGGES